MFEPLGSGRGVDAEEIRWVRIGGGKKSAFRRVGEAVDFYDGMVAMESDGEAAFEARVGQREFEPFDIATAGAEDRKDCLQHNQRSS